MGPCVEFNARTVVLRGILILMSAACTTCNRPVPLSRDEIALLTEASASGDGVRLAELAATVAGCVRPLVRMGYLITAANDDGPRGRKVLITEHGRNWLAANL